MFMHLQHYDIDIQCKKGSEMYLADSGDEVHLIRSAFEGEIEDMPCIEEVNQMIAPKYKMSRLKNETGKDEALHTVKAIIQD